MVLYIQRFPQLLLITLLIGCTSQKKENPDLLIGDFQDDYNIEYHLSRESFTLKPESHFKILEWNIDKQHFIAQNDSSNNFDPNLFSRIDWVVLDDMNPYEWAFCLSAYNAPSVDSAKNVKVADRSMLKTGCNGYPFSRMKPIDK